MFCCNSIAVIPVTIHKMCCFVSLVWFIHYTITEFMRWICITNRLLFVLLCLFFCAIIVVLKGKCHSRCFFNPEG